MHNVEIYTDGSCQTQNPKRPGAIGVVILLNDSIIYEYSKSFINVTNNQMELLSVLIAFKELERLNLLSDSVINVYSDSQYFINGITVWIENWIKKQFNGVKNSDIWKLLYQYKNNNINYIWVKGHNGNHFNELANKLAFQSMMEKANEN